MVRREEASPASGVSSCTTPARESPVPESAGAPGSRPPGRDENREPEARRQEPREREQARGPQHEVKPPASKAKQRGSRAAPVTLRAPRAQGEVRPTENGSLRKARGWRRPRDGRPLEASSVKRHPESSLSCQMYVS